MQVLFVSSDERIFQRWEPAATDRNAIYKALTVVEAESICRKTNSGTCLFDVAHCEIDSLEHMIRQYPEWRFIAMTDVPNNEQGVRLLAAGARGYCNRLINRNLLSRVIEIVKSGEIWAGQSLVAHLIGNMNKAPRLAPAKPVIADLTTREQEIADLVGRGAANKEISNLLGISERTVKAHLGAIFRKSGAKTRVQLALMVNNP